MTYSVVKRLNPANRESGEVKYYAQAQARGVMGIREMSERIQQACTVTRADTLAVLTALEDVVAEGLQSGQIVRLGGLCSLRVSLSGEGSVTEDTFDDSLIERKRVLFSPGEVIREAMNNMVFERVPVKRKKEETGSEPDGEEGPAV